ncbi:MAG: hypothetical protein LAT65_11025 [Saccharospirillum sp.]|nr:hypothetical protein [Saccharospirillum sp.]
MRCPFCHRPYLLDYPAKMAGDHTVKCEQCHRAFLILVRKRWWGWHRESRVR